MYTVQQAGEEQGPSSWSESEEEDEEDEEEEGEARDSARERCDSWLID